ncbi:hypothetical protein A2U01_0110861, partial [Trifolium medium]|nr:hypothetical protein [Trifolium medium]
AQLSQTLCKTSVLPRTEFQKARSRPLLSGMQISTPWDSLRSNLKSMVIPPLSLRRLLRNSGGRP